MLAPRLSRCLLAPGRGTLMAVNLLTSQSLAKENGYMHIYFHVFSDQIITLFLVPMTLCVNHWRDLFSIATG